MTKRTTGWLSGRRADEIAQSVESAIRDEQLAPGDALPTVRAAARMLRVSPATVASAYCSTRDGMLQPWNNANFIGSFLLEKCLK